MDVCVYSSSLFYSLFDVPFIHLQALEVEIKWPNDIYYKRQTKVGGILVTMVTDTTAIMGK